MFIVDLIRTLRNEERKEEHVSEMDRSRIESESNCIYNYMSWWLKLFNLGWIEDS